MNRLSPPAARAQVQAQAALQGRWAWTLLLVLLLAAPFIGLYPIFVMTALCFAIFAMAFNLQRRQTKSLTPSLSRRMRRTPVLR